MPDARLKHADVRNRVETCCPGGHPQVLRCHPLRQGDGRFEPFPTLFWLVCPDLTQVLTRLEYGGWIKSLQARLADDAALRAEVEQDHQAYSAERWSLLSPAEVQAIERRGLRSDFFDRGIGGIRDKGTVKCLHLHYAHHLARGSAIGRILDATGAIAPCRRRHG